VNANPVNPDPLWILNKGASMTRHENLHIRSLENPPWETIGTGIQDFNACRALPLFSR